MSDCWFVVCREGKREIWRLGCKCAIKDTRLQTTEKKFVWVLYRKVAFACTEPSHLFWRLRVVSYSKRSAAALETDQEASCGTPYDIFEYFLVDCFSHSQDSASLF